MVYLAPFPLDRRPPMGRGVFGYIPDLEKIVGKKVKIVYHCSAEMVEIADQLALYSF